MATTAASSLQMATARPCISSSHRVFRSGAAMLHGNVKVVSSSKLSSACHISSVQSFQRSFTSSSLKMDKFVTKAMAGSSENKPSGLPINLKGKRAFIAGVADDNGYGWAIAKSLAAAGAEILVGTWVPALNIFESSLRRGKFDESRVLPDGSLMEITKVYPLDAVFDTLDDVPEEVKSNKRYAGSSNWTVQEAAEAVKSDFGSIDILVHSLANGPEVTKPLLETSRKGYLAAISASSYSYVSLLKHFLPIINPGGSSLSLTYIASERIIPGYGGGMSSAKAALESDTRVLAFEAGRKKRIRVNTISAGPLRSRAAKAIGFIDMMIDYSLVNAPLQKELSAEEVGNTAAFLAPFNKSVDYRVNTQLPTTFVPRKLGFLFQQLDLFCSETSRRRRNMKGTKVAVVGSGISGAVCASSLARNGLSVTLFESARGPGGRMSQRRENVEDGKELLFDHGAPFFTANNTEVLSLVHEWESKGLAVIWKEKFGSFDRTSNKFVDLEQEGLISKRYLGIPGMNSVCRALCREPGVESKFGTSVGRLEWLEDQNLWSLIGLDGQNLGQFKGVVATDKNIVSPRFTSMTGKPLPLDLKLFPELAVKLNDIPVRPCFALMIAFAEPLTSIPFKGFSIKNSEVLSWAHCDSSKPGRSTSSERWVLHSTMEYAQRIIAQTGLQKLSDATLTKVAEELFQELQSLGLNISQPFFKKAHRWGSAFPATSIAREEKCLWDGNKRFAICGDFCVSPDVEGAIVSGLAAASKLSEVFSCL